MTSESEPFAEESVHGRKASNTAIIYIASGKKINYGGKASYMDVRWWCLDIRGCLALTSLSILVGFCLGTLIHYFERDAVCRNFEFVPKSVNESAVAEDADPCDDFYTFACGRWNQTISRKYKYSSVIQEVEIRNLQILEFYLRCSSSRNMNEWSRFMKKTYDLCETERYASIYESKTVSFVKDMAAPLLSRDFRDRSLEEVLERVHHRLLQNGLFSWGVTLGRLADHEIVEVIKISPPAKPWMSDLSLNSSQHLLDYMVKVLSLLGADENRFRPICAKILDTAIVMNSQIKKAQSNLFSFLKMKMFNFAKLPREVKFINFSSYFGNPLPDSASIAVEKLEYFQWLNGYLEKSKKENDVALYDFLTWLSIDFFVPFMPKEFREARRECALKTGLIDSGISHDASNSCARIVNKGMNFATSSFFMDKILKGDSMRRVNEIIQNVKNSFRGFLNNNVRHSKENDRKWLRGLGEVFDRIEIGVPEHLKKVYEESSPPEGDVESNSFPSYYLSAVGFVKRSLLNFTGTPPLGYLFQMDFLQPNAVFMDIPFLAIHVGIFTSPLFDVQQPLHSNYAGFGFILAHELAHSVHLLAMNTTSVKNEVDSKLKCLREQYVNVKQGLITNQEDLADNIGIKVAYDAYLEHFNEIHGRTYEGELSPHSKAFFISYGQTWCEDGSSFETNANRFHSPFKYRTNKPLSNFPVFSKVFDCPAGSTMNTDDKCLI